ncbi:MAG: hypothetical protein IKQ71_11655 [Lachnospiraceae bacterium]|nr:hypothetical protein [Lachnospiraceae bacterium]
MMKLRFIFKELIVTIFAAVLLVFVVPLEVNAKDSSAVYTDEVGKTVDIAFKHTDYKTGMIVCDDVIFTNFNSHFDYELSLIITNNTERDFLFDISSLDTSCGTISEVSYLKKVYSKKYYWSDYAYERCYDKIVPAGESINFDVKVKMLKVSIFDIAITSGDFKYQLSFVLYPYLEKSYYPVDLKQIDVKTISAKVENQDAYFDGYYVYAKKSGSDQCEKIADVPNSNILKFDALKWNDYYQYGLIGYKTYKEVKYTINSENEIFWGERFRCTDPGTNVKVKQNSEASFLITWEKATNAELYELYVAEENEFSSYKKIYQETSLDELQYIHNVKQGITYYYFVKITFSDGQVSERCCKNSGYIPKKNIKAKSKTVKNVNYDKGKAFLLGDKFNYSYNGVDYIAVIYNRNVTIYKRTASEQLKKYKTVKLPKYKYICGFYSAHDGKCYVAIGYDNDKENDKKTVMKVIQYDEKWKKLKTAIISGKSSNTLKGIARPGLFEMTMNEDTLYMLGSRLMYEIDGVRHQSNIAFQINTKTMKVKNENDIYVSHTLGRIVKYKDNDLYLLDHGDAFPSGFVLGRVTDYRKDYELNESNVIYNLEDGSGAHFYGMEVGTKNVLVCATSIPVNYALKSVKRRNFKDAQNLCLLTVDRKTGNHKFKWLTEFHPKKSKTAVYRAAMVKICDDRYGIIYSICNKDFASITSSTFKTYFMVIDEEGNIIKRTKLKGIKYSGENYPIISNGYISWIERYPDGFDNTFKIHKVPVEY